ncbi:MAG: metallophosphoesterase [Tumebacillaceae bacterium]
MKLLSFSDLHIDNTSREISDDVIGTIAAYIKEVAPDRVIVAGDIAGGAEACIRYLEELEQRSGVPHSYVPGNHSIWTMSKETDSWHEYELLKQHHTSLIDKPIELNEEWVLLGDMGWYDYTYREPQVSVQEVIKNRNMIWKDSVMARWGTLSDEDVCAKMLDKFESLLNRYADKKIIFVNHFIPYLDFCPVATNYEIWNMIRPFMGSTKLGDLLDRYEQVKYVIFGHIHRRFGVRQRGEKQIICTPLGYVKEWRTQDLATEIRSSSAVIEI